MAGIFEQPRNAGTLCMYTPRALHLLKANLLFQFSVDKKSAEPTFVIKMVPGRCCILQNPAHTGLVLATQAIANVVKSSFGPSGLDKMMVDDIGVRYLLESLGCSC